MGRAACVTILCLIVKMAERLKASPAKGKIAGKD